MNIGQASKASGATADVRAARSRRPPAGHLADLDAPIAEMQVMADTLRHLSHS